MLPLNVILSYLWLTSLIFTSQDWAGGRCRYNTFNMGLDIHCGLKHTAMAFFIIGLYVCVPPLQRLSSCTYHFCSSTLFLNTIIEAYIWASSRRHTTIGNEKVAIDPRTTNGVRTTV